MVVGIAGRVGAPGLLILLLVAPAIRAAPAGPGAPPTELRAHLDRLRDLRTRWESATEAVAAGRLDDALETLSAPVPVQVMFVGGGRHGTLLSLLVKARRNRGEKRLGPENPAAWLEWLWLAERGRLFAEAASAIEDRDDGLDLRRAQSLYECGEIGTAAGILRRLAGASPHACASRPVRSGPGGRLRDEGSRRRDP